MAVVCRQINPLQNQMSPLEGLILILKVLTSPGLTSLQQDNNKQGHSSRMQTERFKGPAFYHQVFTRFIYEWDLPIMHQGEGVGGGYKRTNINPGPCYKGLATRYKVVKQEPLHDKTKQF